MALDIIVLIYNIFLSCAVCFAVACLYYHYLVGKDKLLCIALIVMFLAYLFDNTIVYCTESIPSFAEVYDKNFLSNPNVKTVYFLIRIGSMLYAFHRLMPCVKIKILLLILILYTTALICMPLIEENDLMVFMYYLPTQLIIFIIGVWGLMMLKRDRTNSAPGDVPLRKLFIFLAIMSAVVFMEDGFVIFRMDIYSAMGLKINNRNVSENILFLGLAFFIINYTKTRLILSPAVNSHAENKQSPIYEKSPLESFSQSLGLTDREQEIFMLLMNDVSQQDISEQLIIALGTVKTHVHNIYKKAGVSNRMQMQAKFKLFCEKISLK